MRGELLNTHDGLCHRPNIPLLLRELKTCSTVKDLKLGKRIHAQAIQTKEHLNICVANTLVYMYFQCGSVTDARLVFDKMLRHDVVSWNILILGYAENGQAKYALQLFLYMHAEGCAPNARTFIAALKACTVLAAEVEGNQKVVLLEKGRAIHADFLKRGHYLDLYVGGTLIYMYANCGSMVDAHQVSNSMQHRDVVSWTALLMGYAVNGEAKCVLELFERMKEEGCVPNARTFVALLKAYSALTAEEEGARVEGKLVKIECLLKTGTIHSEIANGPYDMDIYIANTLIDLYAKCGSLADARRVFDNTYCRDVVSWTTLMLGYAENGEAVSAIQSLEDMQYEGCTPNSRTFVAALKACSTLATGKEGKLEKMWCLEKGKAIHLQVVKKAFELDTYVSNTMIDMYSKCGSMADACFVFDKMTKPDVVSWTALIMGYADYGEAQGALHLFARMQNEGCSPNALTFGAVLMSCGSVGALQMGQSVHYQICVARIQNDLFVANCLVDFYGKCGSMEDAIQVFNSVPRKDTVMWNALIAGYSLQGDAKNVFDLFDKMQKESGRPNAVTFLCVLNACSHDGQVAKARKYFKAMCLDYVISPTIEHYTCMVDVLGRANQLEDAVSMIRRMPFEPNEGVWMALLGACKKWRNVDIGKFAFERLILLDEADAAAYVLMADIYATG